METVVLRSIDPRSGFATGSTVKFLLAGRYMIVCEEFGYPEIRLPIYARKYFEEVRNDG
jgi:hypothetical protein